MLDRRFLDLDQSTTDRFHSKSSEKIIYFSTVFVASILFSVFVSFLAMIYWCSRNERRRKPEETLINTKCWEKSCTNNDLPMFSIVSQHVQPDENDFIADLPIPKAKKNPFERRGSSSALKLSINSQFGSSINTPPRSPIIEDCLKTATRRLTIEQLHQRAQESYSLFEEFWAIPSNHLEKLRLSGTGIKNRYGTIIANEHSRVQLDEIAGDPISSYINANYIRAFPDQYRAFIATQGPLANTIEDFYRMIWQEDVSTIVMMTRLIEQNQSKCERYLPEDEKKDYGMFRIQVQSCIHLNDYEIRRLIIQFNGQERSIDHYWYTAWPDHSCPKQIDSLIDLIKRVEKSRKTLAEINQRTGPVVVHCSAGVGRTGCFIAISNGMKQLDQEKQVDIVRIVSDLRQDRGGMVQNDEQYHFVYRTLSDYARTTSP